VNQPPDTAVTLPDAAAGEARRHKLVLFSIAFASFMVNVDTYIVNVSLPAIARAFQADTALISWVSMAYQLTVTGLLLVFGRLGDRISLKKLFLFGYGVFALGSLACALAGGVYTLIAARAFQGIGASVLYALTPAMVPRFLPDSMRGPAFGTLASAAALGIMLGNPVGGLIAGYLSWKWIFLINVPIGLVAMWVCQRVIPAEQPKAAGPMPASVWVAAVLSFLFLLVLMVSLNRGNRLGWSSPEMLASLSMATLALIGFAMWEARSASPLMDYSLFQNTAFSLANAAYFFTTVFLAGNNFLMPFYLMMIRGMSSQQAGGLLLVYSLVYVWVGPLAGKLSKKIDPKHLCTTAAAGGALLSLYFAWALAQPGLTYVVLYVALLGVVYATFFPSNNTLVMSMAPRDRQGIVSASFRMIGRVGMALGICLFEAMLSMSTHNEPLPGHQVTVAPASAHLLAFQQIYELGCILLALGALLSWLSGRVKKPAAVVSD